MKCLLAAVVLGACSPATVPQPSRAPRGEVDARPASASHRFWHRSEVVARVDDAEITREDLDAAIEQQHPRLWRPASTSTAGVDRAEARRREVLEELIRTELLAQEALRRGLDRDPIVRRAVSRALAERLTAQLVDEPLADAEAADDDLRRYYQDHLAEFQRPGMVRYAAIVIMFDRHGGRDRSRLQAEAMLAEVEAALAPLTDLGERRRAFGGLADRLSEVPARRGGDRGFVTLDGSVDAARDGAASLTAVGEISGLVELPAQWEIVQLSGRRAPVTRRFEDVRSSLRARVRQEERARRFDQLMQALQRTHRVRAP